MKIWVYADPHFYHTNIVKFVNRSGERIRPLWNSAEHMTEDLIRWYNELVRPGDKVYFLGDIAFSRKALDRSLPRLMGTKILIKGNHDEDKLSYYSQYFKDVRAYKQSKGYIMSHIPIHPGSLGRWGFNIHGHLHGNTVGDPRYRCVSVEQTNWRPILLNDVLKEKPA